MYLSRMSIFCAGTTAAMQYARSQLHQNGCTVTDTPQWNTTHLLLDVPSFRPGSPLLEHGNLDTLLCSLPEDTVICGGGLDQPQLEKFRRIDLLQDEQYLAENAAITAHCTLQLSAPMLKTTWKDTPVLILGWGRIGKCLGTLLKSLNCPVAVMARSERDRAALVSLGFRSLSPQEAAAHLSDFRMICNTIPAQVLSGSAVCQCAGVIKIDLASQKGLIGEDVIWARGLPGIHAPESSGKLIAKTILRLDKEAGA